jgi:hypothetical protein
MKIVRPTKNLRWSRRVPPKFPLPGAEPQRTTSIVDSTVQGSPPVRYRNPTIGKPRSSPKRRIPLIPAPARESSSHQRSLKTLKVVIIAFSLLS